MIHAAPKEPGDKSKTGVVFSAVQWVYIIDLWEKLRQPVAEAVAEAEIEVEADDDLNDLVIALIISLLAQETSQLLLYESPVIHYLAICGINPQTNRFYSAF